MATSEPQGTNASIWAHAHSATPSNMIRNWAREKEPGSAFRGIPTRGRGRGRGRAPSDRGGRRPPGVDTPLAEVAKKSVGGDTANNQTKKPEAPAISQQPTSQPQTKPNKTDVPKQPISSSEKPSAESSSATPARNSRPRPHSKRGSQRSSLKVPDLRVDTSNAQVKDKPLPSATEAVVNTPNRPGHSRRGSRHRLRTPTTPAKSHTSESESQTRPVQRNPSKKDTSPHLSVSPMTPSVNARNSVDSLVEHYRASAMEQHRPGSPHSHIDWAGEEDDTLPDLDDWMLDTKTASASGHLSPINEKPQGISPVETAGKPETSGGNKISPSPNGYPARDRPLAQDSVKGKKNDRKRGRGREKEKGTSSGNSEISPESTLPPVAPAKPVKEKPNGLTEPANPESCATLSSEEVTPPDAVSVNVGPGSSSTISNETEASKKLHPSLPAKPQSRLAPQKHPLPSKPDATSWRSSKTSDEQSERSDNSSNPIGPSTISKPSIELELKLDQSPEDSGNTTDLDKSAFSNSPGLGVLGNLPHSAPPAQAIHAEGPSKEHFHVPTLSVDSIDTSFIRSGSATPRRGRDRSPLSDSPNARARSSPQTGPRTAFTRTRPPAASRPIITFSALQQISKSLGAGQGGHGALPRRDETPAATAAIVD